MDPAISEQDPDLVEALLESMMAEQQIAREIADKAMNEDKKEQKKEEKEKKGEEEKKEKKPQYTMLKVKVGSDSVFEDMDCSRLVYKVLKDRL